MKTYILIVVLKLGGGFSAEFASHAMCNAAKSDIRERAEVVLAECYPKGD